MSWLIDLPQVKSDYLLVFLCKLNPGSNWTHITYAEKVQINILLQK